MLLWVIFLCSPVFREPHTERASITYNILNTREWPYIIIYIYIYMIYNCQKAVCLVTAHHGLQLPTSPTHTWWEDDHTNLSYQHSFQFHAIFTTFILANTPYDLWTNIYFWNLYKQVDSHLTFVQCVLDFFYYISQDVPNPSLKGYAWLH